MRGQGLLTIVAGCTWASGEPPTPCAISQGPLGDSCFTDKEMETQGHSHWPAGARPKPLCPTSCFPGVGGSGTWAGDQGGIWVLALGALGVWADPAPANGVWQVCPPLRHTAAPGSGVRPGVFGLSLGLTLALAWVAGPGAVCGQAPCSSLLGALGAQWLVLCAGTGALLSLGGPGMDRFYI